MRVAVQFDEGLGVWPVAAAPALPRLERRTARRLATAGRFGVAWLPAYAALTLHAPSLQSGLLVATLVACVWLVTLHKACTASPMTLLALGPAVAVAAGTVSGGVVVSALSIWVELHLSPAALAGATLGVYLLAWVWEVLVARSVAGTRSVLVLGGGAAAERLAADVEADPHAPFEIVAATDGSDAERAASLVELHRPDLVVLACDPEDGVFERLLDVAGAGFKLVGLAEFYEHAYGRVPVGALRRDWFMSVLHLYQRPYGRLAKRAFDVAVALVGAVAVCWLLPLVWLLVRRTGGPGPAIYRQTRLGEGGRLFTIYKFRTMRADAEAGGAVWAAQDDPRVTPVGRFLRKTRLDELPQLWNVLRGDMSIVGPRPERPEFLATLQAEVPFWTRRHLVKPGITGWAQVRRGYTADAQGTAEKLAYDLWYLRHRSLLIDVVICVKTFTTLVTGAGAR